MKVLLVEDNGDKAQRVADALVQTNGFNAAYLDHVGNINAAKQKLREVSYDLLILDIALPIRVEELAREEAGVRLLKEVYDRGPDGVYKVPDHIIGLTAYPDVLDQVAQQFSEKLLSVVFYDPTSDEWQRRLQELTRHIIAAKADQQVEPVGYQSFLGVVCALRSPELDQVLNLPWQWVQYHHQNDDTIYYSGTVSRGSQTQTVIAAAAPRMGMPATTALAMKTILQFRPRYLAMTGITAGIHSKTKFGDILVADPSYDGGSGKWALTAGQLSFQPSPYQLPLVAPLRNKLKAMESDHLALAQIRQHWQGDLPEHVLSMKVGPVASGAAVLADGTTAEEIVKRQRDVVGIEMETYGLFVAADEAPNPKPAAFSMKSVVDFANPKKKDNFQKYAAFTSAQALKHFVENYLLL